MTPERLQRFQEVATRRQFDFTVILENVHDPHNISAVLRTCDSVGINEIFVLYTDPQLDLERFKLGAKSASGAQRWVDVHYYTDPEACFSHVRNNYHKVFSTHLSEEAVSLYDLELTGPVALLFGNEHDGVSAAALKYSDGNFIIPQMGMVQSLNISVACAICLYEGLRQRQAAGYYRNPRPAFRDRREALWKEFARRHEAKEKRLLVTRINKPKGL